MPPYFRLAAAIIVLAALAAPTPAPASNCNVTSVNRTPINDLGPGLYLNGYQGGLYPSGSNTMPAAHQSAGMARAAGIRPLDTSGQPSTSGRVVLLSIGMSNTTQEFCSQNSNLPCDAWTFMGQAAGDFRVNHTTLAIVNGAAGSQTAVSWSTPTAANYDRVRDTKLVPQGFSEQQVQAVWLKEADANPTASLTFPNPNPNADAYALETYLGDIARAARVRYPNLRILFLSSRIYAGYATGVSTLNPEPYAYESAFSVKWLIEAQISQAAGGGVDARAGDLNFNTVAPWLAWGPYPWADGMTPRSDGLTWACSEIESDGTHPAQPAEQKVGHMLLDFMVASPFATPWFRACLRGDTNGDGRVDGGDIGGFVNVMLNPGGASALQRCGADANNDGTDGSSDLPAFVGLLLGS